MGLIKGKLWYYITNEQEDQAIARLKKQRPAFMEWEIIG